MSATFTPTPKGVSLSRPAARPIGGQKQSQDPANETQVVGVDAKRATAFVVNTSWTNSIKLVDMGESNIDIIDLHSLNEQNSPWWI